MLHHSTPNWSNGERRSHHLKEHLSTKTLRFKVFLILHCLNFDIQADCAGHSKEIA